MSHLRRSERINPNLNKKMFKSMNRSKMNNPLYAKLNSNQKKEQFRKEENDKVNYSETCDNNTSLISNENEESITEEMPLKVTTLDEPMEQKSEIFVESNTSPSDKSAITKALDKLEKDDKGRKKRKNVKIPVSVKKQKLNTRLSKVLTPKSASLLLHELKPNCVFKIQTQSELKNPVFVASVKDNEVVIGVGQGLSKSLAKNAAAENAIKTIVSKVMAKKKENPDQSCIENFPWAGLASFAMHKMFTDWQNQGADVPLLTPSAKPSKVTIGKRELPPNAEQLHPAVLLNISYPGLLAQELNREAGPEGKVTMGYEIDGKMYTGEGRNKKDAKKEAAKAAIAALYGLNCAV